MTVEVPNPVRVPIAPAIKVTSAIRTISIGTPPPEFASNKAAEDGAARTA
jgi:hypothetical protein